MIDFKTIQITSIKRLKTMPLSKMMECPSSGECVPSAQLFGLSIFVLVLTLAWLWILSRIILLKTSTSPCSILVKNEIKVSSQLAYGKQGLWMTCFYFIFLVLGYNQHTNQGYMIYV